MEKSTAYELRCLSKGRPPHQQRCRRIRCQNLDSTAYETSWDAGPEMAHRPCLLSAHVPSATAGMTSLHDHLRPILGCTQQAGQTHLNSDATIAHEGRPQGGEGTHKGCPYQLSSLGVLPCEGHPQGVPLPIVLSRRFALGRAPTRGAPTDCLLSAFCPGKGTHKGCPYRLSSLGVLPWEGHPQGVPLPIVLSAFCPGKGTHKGCPYRLSSLGVLPWEGHPQGVPLPIVLSRRFALRRAPTRGAPTRFRQPHEVFLI